MRWLLLLLLGVAVAVGVEAAALRSSVRSLHVRSIPGIHGVTSNIYEIYMQPYSYGVRPLTALVDLHGDGEGGVKGELTLTQIHPPNGPVLITGNITGLAKGQHGFHVHEAGDLRKGCTSVGGHFNPYMQPHGGPIDPYRHVGDLGNVLAGDDGLARVELWDHGISLIGGHSVMGRSLVVHAMRDDMGRGGDVESVTTGNSGDRLACGIIAHMVPEAPSWEWNYPVPPGLGPVDYPLGPPPPPLGDAPAPAPAPAPEAAPAVEAAPAPESAAAADTQAPAEAPAGPALEANREEPCCSTTQVP